MTSGSFAQIAAAPVRACTPTRRVQLVQVGAKWSTLIQRIITTWLMMMTLTAIIYMTKCVIEE